MSNQESEALYRGKRHYDKDGKPLGGIKVMVDDAYMVEVEGGEYKICNDAYNSDEVLSFKNKTNKEILDYIHNDFSCKFEQSKADSGDFILCRLVVNDKKKKNYSGTVRQVLDMMQSEHSCRVSFGDKSMKKGGEISPEEIEARWRKKKESIERLSEKIRSLRNNLTRDIKGEDERERLTALAISVIDKTAERVGNSDSEENGHFGVTGFKKKHIKVDGNTVYLNYIGKSGVKHEKQFSDELIAGALKQAMKNSSCEYVFCTADGFRIKPEKINRYLSDYGVTAKDIRGYSANRWIVDKLNNIDKSDIPETEAKRKRRFNQVLKSVAAKVGHGSGTLKKHYMIPELESAFVEGGEILDLSNFYSKGGYVRLSKTPAPKSDRIYGSKKNAPKSAASKQSGKNIELSNSVVSSILKKLKEHNTKHPDKKVTLGVAKAVVRRGMGAYSVTHRPTIKGGQPNSRVAWGLARLNAFLIKAATGKSKSGRYSQDNDLLNELNIPHKKYEDGGQLKRHIVGCLIYSPEQGFLILQRGDDCEKNAGKWHILSGGVDDGEELEMAALREIEEEIGFDGEMELEELATYDFGDYNFTYFLAIPKEAIIAELNYENKDFVWVNSIDEMLSYDLIPQLKDYMAEFNKGFSGIKSDAIFNNGGGVSSFKRGKFSSMPRNYQVGVVIRAYEVNEDIDWSIIKSNIDWLNDNDVVDIIISDYQKHYPNREFAYGLIETKKIIERVSESSVIDEYEDFEDYHRAYSSTNYANYNSAEIPILVDDSEDEFIEDGWHRFHRYVDLGLEKVPVVSYNANIRMNNGGELLLAPNGMPSNLTPEQWHLVRTPAFKAWFGDWENDTKKSSKVLDENGEPLVVYHGTTHEWTKYSTVKGNPENDLGRGFYATSSIQDAIENYDENGKDLTTRIDSYAEFIEREKGIDKEKARWIAEKKIKGNTVRVISVFLKIKNPFVISESWADGTYFDFNDILNTEGDGYEDYLPSKQWQEFEKAFKKTAGRFNLYESEKIFDEIKDKIFENGESEIKGKVLIQKLKESYGLLDYIGYDKDGRNLQFEFIKELILEMGYDGFIYDNPKLHFTGMAIPSGTKHFIVFDSYKIKLADGSNTTFSPSSTDIRLEEGGELLLALNGKPSNLTPEQWHLVRTPAFKAWFGDWENDPENSSKVVDENGEPMICFHGTNSNPFYVFDEKQIGRLDAGYYGRGFYFVFYPFNPKLAKGEASYYGKNIIGAFLNARNPFDISILSEYKGQKISTIGAESAVFIRNIARMFPEVNFYGARKIEYGETNDDGSVSIKSTDVSSNDYAELFDKYDKEIEWIDSGDRLLALVDGNVVERLELIQKNRENGFYGDNLNMAKAILINKVIEQIHKIGVVYMPEGIMTRNPEITTLLRDGHDAIMQSKQGDEVVVFGANQIKLADGTNTTFDGNNPDIRYEDGGEILSQNKLIALHNISPNQIRDVDYMGGMITPSVAILKAGEPYYDFGTITLIADKELIDPQQYGVRVFSGDVYSPSVPRKEYYIDRKIEKKIRELVSKAYSYNGALGNVLENLIDDISPFYKDMKRMSRAELIERYFDKLKIAFLIDKGVRFDVPFTRVKSYLWGNTELEVPESEIERAKELLGRYRKETEASSSELTDETRREILAFFKKIVESIKEKESVGSGVAIKEEMREAYSNIVRDTYSKLIERYIGDETFLSPHAIDKLGQVVYGKKELDKEALQISVESLFDESLNKEYRDWLENYIYKYQGSAYFEKGKSKIPYNLENLVEASINRTRGEEKLLTYGYNKAKSFGLKEFSSIDSMRKLSNILVSKEEMDRVDEENKEGFFELSRILKSSQREWDKLDSLGKALADYFKGSSARSALSKNGFIIRYESELDDFKSYAEKLKKSPVDYFEAKLLRAVKLSEFKYAVVPDNLEKEIVEILEMNNLPVLYYKAEDNKDRAEKVMQAATEGDLIFKRGGLITEENRELYKEWKRLVNMTASEIKKFYQSEEGKEAGLKPSEAKDLGIHYGRESARWIIKMKKTPVAKWTPTMWEWAKRQIRFNSRMLGNKGALYDEKGNKTRKHTSLLIWGHNPEKKENGGYVNEGEKSRAKYFSDLVDFIYSIFECEYLGNSVDRSCVIYKLNKTENSEELFVLLRSKIEREGFDFIDLNGSKISNSGKELIIKVT